MACHDFGESKIRFETEEEEPRSMKFQRGDKCTKTLAAVSSVCDADHIVLTHKQGGQMIRDKDGKILKAITELINSMRAKTTPFRRKGNIYVMDMWIKGGESYTGANRNSKIATKAPKNKRNNNMEVDAMQENEDAWCTRNTKGRIREQTFQRPGW